MVDERVWLDRAACAGMWDLFSPKVDADERADAGRAVHICRSHCPVLARCDELRTQMLERPNSVWANCVIAGVHYGTGGARRQTPASSRACAFCVGLR